MPVVEGTTTMPPEMKECPFCAETIKSAAKKCKHCSEFLDGHTRGSILGQYFGGDQVGGNKTNIRDLNDAAAAVGYQAMAANTGNVDTLIQAQGDINLGKKQRDEQFEIALNWDGKRRMREFDLSGRNLSSIDLAGADLQYVTLVGSALSGTNLSGANLTWANLGNANLYWANLSKSNLFYANLTNANLGLANLNSSNLAGVSLYNAFLFGADLMGANLLGANLTLANLNQSKYNKKTLWPIGYDPFRAGAIFIDN